MPDIKLNPAEQAAQKALAHMYACIDKNESFRLEAGAGAGKTYSLMKALKYLTQKRGASLLRQNQRIACITFTNVASEEIKSRTDGHPAIHSSTIHSFCWTVIKDFQSCMRNELPNINNWSERLEGLDGVGTRRIDYNDLGHRKVDETHISLHHDDVLALTIKLMEFCKFRHLVVAHYPILFIDEYQDTDKGFAEVLKTKFIGARLAPLMGFFGDHWQKIYGSGCGKIEHPGLIVIGKEANFRSVPVIVNALNKMRKELPQHVVDPGADGSVAIYHTNEWTGERLKGQHWGGDLPPEVGHDYLKALTRNLASEGWDFLPSKTKILMLTHKVLAREQGYNNLADVFPYNDMFIKKEDPHIAFLVDTIEPICNSYESNHFGEMFTFLSGRAPAIRSRADKIAWKTDMDTLLELRATKTVGALLDYLRQTRRIQLPEAVERREKELEQVGHEPDKEESDSVSLLQKLREVPYQEVVSLAQFIDEKTPFSTKHGVKGAEFENVLVVMGRGWSQYNFNEFLEWSLAEDKIPSDKKEKFERNRNLFYVVCSRPKKRLTILFTQKLTGKAVATLSDWYGAKAIHSFSLS